MKKLILTLASTAMMGCATMPKVIENLSQENIFRNLGVPLEFVNYEKKC